MYRRSLPPFPDLSAFLAHLDSKGGVRTIAAPIDMNLEITEVHRRVIAAGGPVLRFERAIAAGLPSTLAVVANLFGTRERVAAGLGTVPSESGAAWCVHGLDALAAAAQVLRGGRAAVPGCARSPAIAPEIRLRAKGLGGCSAGFIPTAGADLLARRRGAAHHLAHRHHSGAR